MLKRKREESVGGERAGEDGGKQLRWKMFRQDSATVFPCTKQWLRSRLHQATLQAPGTRNGINVIRWIQGIWRIPAYCTKNFLKLFGMRLTTPLCWTGQNLSVRVYKHYQTLDAIMLVSSDAFTWRDIFSCRRIALFQHRFFFHISKIVITATLNQHLRWRLCPPPLELSIYHIRRQTMIIDKASWRTRSKPRPAIRIFRNLMPFLLLGISGINNYWSCGCVRLYLWTSSL